MKMSLNAFQLKVIALISMTIDHIGFFLFPDVLWLRIIGRIAFVIFAYFTANAFVYSHNRVKHLLTLFILGIAMDIATLLAGEYVVSNIFITLGFGFALIMAYNAKNYWIMIGLCIISYFFWNMDYGLYGVLLILACYKYFKNIDYLLFANLLLTLVFVLLNKVSDIQLYSTFGIMLLYFYNFQKGRSMKYLFYIYYPLHVVILQFLATTTLFNK